MTPLQQWVAFYTLARREVCRFFRIWPQTLLPPLVTVGLYLVIFGQFIGSLMGPIAGMDYMSYLVPGLMMMTVIESSYSNVVGSFYIAKFQRDVEQLLISPMPIWAFIAGYLVGGLIRGYAVAFLVLLISLFFWEPHCHSLGLVFLFLTFTSLLFSVGGMINGIFAKKFDDITLFATFIVVPLSYLGGVFYSIDALPDRWRALSQFNPILYMISGLRYGFYGEPELYPNASLFFLLLLTSLLMAFLWWLVRKGIGLKY